MKRSFLALALILASTGIHARDRDQYRLARSKKTVSFKAAKNVFLPVKITENTLVTLDGSPIFYVINDNNLSTISCKDNPDTCKGKEAFKTVELSMDSYKFSPEALQNISKINSVNDCGVKILWEGENISPAEKAQVQISLAYAGYHIPNLESMNTNFGEKFKVSKTFVVGKRGSQQNIFKIRTDKTTLFTELHRISYSVDECRDSNLDQKIQKLEQALEINSASRAELPRDVYYDLLIDTAELANSKSFKSELEIEKARQNKMDRVIELCGGDMDSCLDDDKTDFSLDKIKALANGEEIERLLMDVFGADVDSHIEELYTDANSIEEKLNKLQSRERLSLYETYLAKALSRELVKYSYMITENYLRTARDQMDIGYYLIGQESYQDICPHEQFEDGDAQFKCFQKAAIKKANENVFDGNIKATLEAYNEYKM